MSTSVGQSLSTSDEQLVAQLERVSALRRKIEDCLLFGPSSSHREDFDVDLSAQTFHDDDDKSRYLHDVKERVESLGASSKKLIRPMFQELREKCITAKNHLTEINGIRGSHEKVLDKFREYTKTEYKIQLWTIVQLLGRLDKATNILDVPPIILELKDAAKFTILEKTKIYTCIQNTINTKKATLLEKFHRLFEEHLDSEIESDSSNETAQERSQENIYDYQKQIWHLFLQRSRQWLLAYALVSILPAVLIKSPKMILMRFKEALDEAMTPLWGRFYHHLKMGRDSYSHNQILWTFKYAASFLEMVQSLGQHITAADEMTAILQPPRSSSHPSSSSSGGSIGKTDFKAAASAQVLEKALKFLNAHLASIFVAVSPWEDGFGLQLVDEIIDFDHWMATFFATQGVTPPGFLAHVLYESKVFFHHWLLLEQSLIYQHFYDRVCISTDVAFIPKFCTILRTNEEDRKNNDNEGNRGDYSQSSRLSLNLHRERSVDVDVSARLTCYTALYDCLSMFLTSRQRYAYFPPAAQWILAEVILEPLLCVGLGLCLYKIRSDELLFPISIGQLTTSSNIALHLQNASVDEIQSAVTTFKDSVAYFQTALSPPPSSPAPSSTAISLVEIGNVARCRKRWSILQEWMPKLLLTSSLQTQGYALRDLVRTAMKVSDKYRQHQHFAYRGQWYEHQQQLHQQQQKHGRVPSSATSNTPSTSSTAQSETPRSAPTLTTVSDAVEPDEATSLEACVVMTRGLAITVVDVLEEQLTLYLSSCQP